LFYVLAIRSAVVGRLIGFVELDRDEIDVLYEVRWIPKTLAAVSWAMKLIAVESGCTGWQ
jgi:hypothetical protein